METPFVLCGVGTLLLYIYTSFMFQNVKGFRKNKVTFRNRSVLVRVPVCYPVQLDTWVDCYN
jgi:hypothetical protein